MVIVLDFAENYGCFHQDEIRSAQWAVNQVTVNPSLSTRVVQIVSFDMWSRKLSSSSVKTSNIIGTQYSTSLIRPCSTKELYEKLDTLTSKLENITAQLTAKDDIILETTVNHLEQQLDAPEQYSCVSRGFQKR